MTRIIAGTDEQHRTAGPYSPVLELTSGPIVVLSGQGPLDMDGHVVGDDITTQTRVTLENCSRLLNDRDIDLNSVFKVNVFLADLADWEEFNAEYLRHMTPPLPVRTTVGVSLLLGMKVEIEMWAAR